MQSWLEKHLTKFYINPDSGIYIGKGKPNEAQAEEILLRKGIANAEFSNYLEVISKHHSIPVMDFEVQRFLRNIPKNGLILDIGGCWGWHWRHIADKRPNVNVVLIDFVHANLEHAKKVLGPLIGSKVFLMEADATDLPFVIDQEFEGFDGVWTVQTLQHIPDFELAVSEAKRVLVNGGLFLNYSLHKTPLNRLIYFFFGKKYHTEGEVAGAFYLSKAGKKHLQITEKIFNGKVKSRYTECIFQPDFKVTFTGCNNNLLGKFDAWLGNLPWIGYWIARQLSFEVVK